MELILHNPSRHITLIVDPLTNHLSLQDLTHGHIIILMETICQISILIAGMMIMMILCLVIQCGNDYISRYLWIILCNLLYYVCILISFYRRRLYLCFHVMFWVLGDVLSMWYMNFNVYIFFYDLSWFFHNFFSVLCSVLRVSSKSDPSRRDRSVSVPAETETLNHANHSYKAILQAVDMYRY